MPCPRTLPVAVCLLSFAWASDLKQPPQTLRRLTHTQYNHTVLDLLGDATQPASQFPPEDFVHGFKTQYEAQSIPPLLAEAYSAAAERLARNAFRGGDTRRLIPCRPEDPSCPDQFVRTFGRRAFRRPLTEAEVKRYLAFFSGSRPLLEGAQLVVEAMLQSPHFLFYRQQDPASRLAFFLWDSTPDEALLAAAERGELRTPEGVEKQARRLVGDPKARRSVDEFSSQWLRFDRVLTGVKDRRTFPSFSPEMARSMVEETRLLINDLVWKDGNFMDLFRAGYSFVNGDLAALYGLEAPPEDFVRTELPPGDRAGLLGHGSFLAMTSKPGDTSPTARGLFIREQFLCQMVPQPPPGVNSNLPPVTPAKPMTNRERLAEHTNSPSCAGCHQLIDPIGFALEKFDAIGQYRPKLKLTFLPERRDRESKPVTVELELDTRGSIAGVRNSSVTSPRELGRLLADSPLCQQCVVKQLFRYANGRLESGEDRPVVRRALEDFQKSGFRFRELMVSLIRHTLFPPAQS